MQDAHIVAVDLGGVGGLQHGGHLLHHVYGEGAGLVQAGAVRHRGLNAVGPNLGAVEHVGAGLQNVSRNGVQGQAGLTAHGLGGLQHVIVNGGQVQHIGQADEVAVLVYLRFHGSGAELPALGGDALGQGLQSLGQGGIAPELNALAAILGNGPLLAELAVDQVRPCLLYQSAVIKGLVFRGQLGVGGDVHRRIVRKVLQRCDVHKSYLLSILKTFPCGEGGPPP